jgi:hypothetical protein
LRRTIITPSHFTTFIQSWRVNPASLFLCFLLFLFLSCRDDAAFVGFPKPPRLTTQFVDIPVNPKVLLIDGVLTRNSDVDLIKRFIIGRNSDLKFGSTQATAYSNFAPPITVPAVPSTATFDSLVVQLQLDNYYYGSAAVTQQTIRVFEVLDTIIATAGYYSTSTLPTSPAPLGEITFTVDPVLLDNGLIANSDTDTANNIYVNVRIKLAGALGPNLLADLQQDPQSLIIDPDAFSAKYKGLAFVSVSGDKLLGVNPVFTSPYPKAKDTKLSLYYTDAGIQARTDFVFFFAGNQTYGQTYPAISFTNFVTDRTGTALNGIQPFQDFVPADNMLYLQSGTALATKIDLTPFYDYIDTLENAVFNSAELIATNTIQSAPPQFLQLKMLDANNQFIYPYYDTLVFDVLSRNTLPYFTKQPSAWVIESGTTQSTIDVRIDHDESILVDPTTFAVGNIYITEFCQQAYRNKNDKRRIMSLALMPATTEFQKSLNGLVLDKNMSIRLYYSKPIIKIR